MDEYNNTNHIIMIISEYNFLIYDIPIGKTTKEIVSLIEDGENILTCQYIFDNYQNNLIHVGYHSYTEDIDEESYETVDYHISTDINTQIIWKIIDIFENN